MRFLLLLAIIFGYNAAFAADSNTRNVTSMDIMLNLVNGVSHETKFGRNPDIDIGATEDLWANGGTYTGQPISFTPETVTCASSSAADTSAGTGARTLQVYGLASDTSEEYTSEILTLNGTSNVITSGTYYRMNRAIVLTAGTGGGNAGTITCNSTATTANVFLGIPPGNNQTMIGAWTVPAGKRAVIKRVRIAMARANGSPGSANITLRVRSPGGVYRAARNFEITTGTDVNYVQYIGDSIVAGTDMKITIESVSDNNSIFDGALEMIIIDDN